MVFHNEENNNKDHITLESENWISKISKIMAIWGIINFLIAPVLFGILLIIFAIITYYTKNLKTIRSLGIIFIIIALLQVVIGLGNIGINDVSSILLVMGCLNFIFAGELIFKSKKLETNL